MSSEKTSSAASFPLATILTIVFVVMNLIPEDKRIVVAI